jgi:flagellar biosynthesis anti-sigma factor FlgM
MNIDPRRLDRVRGDTPAAPATGSRGPEAVRRAGEGGANPPAPGTFDLSARARDFMSIRPRLEALPETSSAREARIEALRASIADGRYAVSGEDVAAAMLADESVARMLGVPPSR